MSEQSSAKMVQKKHDRVEVGKEKSFKIGLTDFIIICRIKKLNNIIRWKFLIKKGGCEMSGENVRITFDSYMYDTDEHIQVSATGVHSIKDGMHYVVYTEQVEGGQSVRNILKFDGEALEVSKIGTTRTNMYYKPGHKHTDVYRTPLGEYDMCIDTEKYILVVSEQRYKLVTEYKLELGGVHVSKCKVEISIE